MPTQGTLKNALVANVERSISFENIYEKEGEETTNVNNVAALDLRKLSPPPSTKPPQSEKVNSSTSADYC